MQKLQLWKVTAKINQPDKYYAHLTFPMQSNVNEHKLFDINENNTKKI